MAPPADNFSVRVTGSLDPSTLRGLRVASRTPGLALIFVALFLALAGSAQATIVRSAAGREIGVTLRQGVRTPAGAGTVQTLGAQGNAASGTLVYHGGYVLHASAPYVIFWTPPGQSIPASTQSLIQRYFTDAAADSATAGNEFGVDRQYTDGSGFADYRQTFSAASQVITDTSAYPARDATNCPNVASSYPTCITDSQLESEVTRVISAHGLPGDGAGKPPAPAPIYFVVLPTDVNACYSAIECADGQFCAYHSSYANSSDGQNIVYALIPTIILGPGMTPKSCQYDGNSAVQEPNGTTADVVIKYLNHEENEAITDPYGNAWWVAGSQGGQEEADECNQYGTAGPLNSQSLNAFAPVLGGSASAGTLYDQLIDGHDYYLQSEWSNGDSACELRPTGGSITPRMSISPSTPVTAGTQLTFDPSSSASTSPYSSATWNFGDGSSQFESHSAAMNVVTHTYAQGGTYTVTETLVDNRGNLAVESQPVTVYSNPTAGFTTTTALPYVGGATAFDASASSDPDSGVTITSYAWNFGDGITATTSSPTTTHTFVQPGTYTVTLTVTNSVGLTSTTSNTVTIHPLPSSVFTPTPTTPLVNQSVAFDGSGSVAANGSIVSYRWSFGDGSSPVSGSSATTSHTYTQAGVYTASLTVTETDGLSRTSSQQLIVGSPPSTSFAVTTASPVQSYPVSFDASASSDSDAGVSIASYSWNFGDGSIQTTATPTISHTFSQPGTYTVTLTVTNTIGLTSMQSQSLSVDELPSSIFNMSPSSPPVGQTVTFEGSGSVDPDGSIVNYSWNFGDGSSTSGSSAAATHNYTAPGIYPVALTVTDSDGHTRTSSQQLTVGSPPTASLQVASPSDPVQGSPVNFDASASSDLDSGVSISSYNWSFGDGSAPLTTNSPMTSYTYAQPGTYTVSLTVTNTLGLTSTPVTRSVSVDELPTVSFTTSPSAPLAGTALTFDGSGSRDSDGSIATYSWDFGDGSVPVSGPNAMTTHAYSATGTYSVALTVTDSDGHSATLTQPVSVYALPTAAFASAPQTPIAGAPVTIDATGSTDPNGSTITSYMWSFGDGSAAVTTATPTTSHTYAHPGTYTITLTITDALGLTATSTSAETIDALPAPAFGTAPQTPVTNQLIGFDAAGSTDPNHAAITTYRWDFGDGTITTGPSSSASHAYGQPGTYTALLTVTDSLGLSASVTHTLTIRALPSGAFTTSPQAPQDGTAITFNGGGSSDPNGSAITTYSWNFGDGRTASSGSPTVTHVYAGPGSYLITLTVTDALGLSTTASRTEVVADEPPVALARVLTSHPVTGQQIAFDGTRSNDPDGSITGYAWSFGDHTKTASGGHPAHSYAGAGTYRVQLTVTDSSGEHATTTASVTVTAAAHITAMKAQMTAHGPVLLITLSGAGMLRYGSRKIVVHRAGTVRVRLELTRSQVQHLNAHGALKIHFPVTFTPRVGGASNQHPILVFRVLRQHGLAVALIRH